MPTWGYFAIIGGALAIHLWVVTLEQQGPIVWLLDKLGIQKRLPRE